MGYPTDIDEMDEKKLHDELDRRAKLRARGLCDYCGRLPSEPTCMFPDRHNPAPKIPDKTVELLRWIANTVHQAYHHEHLSDDSQVDEDSQKPWYECSKSVCKAVFDHVGGPR